MGHLHDHRPTAPGQLADPRLHVGEPDVRHPGAAPARLDMQPPHPFVGAEPGRLQVTALAVQPRRSQLADGDPAQRRRDVLAAQLGDLHRGGEPFGVALGGKAALVGLAILGCAVADPVKRCAA